MTCERCNADHVADGLFRLATLRAGLKLVGNGRGQTFSPTGPVDPSPPSPDKILSARRRLVRAAATTSVHTTPDDLAAWFGWHSSSVKEVLDEPPEPPPRSRTTRTFRLVPPRDPWLAGSDRAWLMGDNVERRSEVFRSLGAPGVMLCKGEIVGIWQQRIRSSRLAIEVDASRPLTDDERDQVLADAATVAACRDRRTVVSGWA